MIACPILLPGDNGEDRGLVVSDDEPLAEHRLHWLLDALYGQRRRRAEKYGVGEPEILGLQRALWASIDRGEFTVALAVDRLLGEVSRRLDERRAIRRRAPTWRVASSARPERRDAFETSAGGFVLPRRRDLVSLDPVAPWLLDEMQAPAGRHRRLEPRAGSTPLARRSEIVLRGPWVGSDVSARETAAGVGTRTCKLRLTMSAPRGDRARGDGAGSREEGRVQTKRRRTVFRIPGLRVSLIHAPGVTVERRPLVRSHRDVAPLLTRYIGDAVDREHLVAALVDASARVIGLTTIAIGTGNEVEVRLADVYRPLILAAADRYYVGHNHPSGDVEPSIEDLKLTRYLHATGLSLGIELCDHLVIGVRGAYRSLRAHGEGVPAWREEARACRDGGGAPAARSGAGVRVPWTCQACGRMQTQKERRCRACGAVALPLCPPVNSA